MADAKRTLAQVAGAFEKVSADYEDELTKVKDAALRNKTQCEQFSAEMSGKFLALANTVQTSIKQVQGLMDELRPIIARIPREGEPARTGTPAKRPAKKRNKKV